MSRKRSRQLDASKRSWPRWAVAIGLASGVFALASTSKTDQVHNSGSKYENVQASESPSGGRVYSPAVSPLEVTLQQARSDSLKRQAYLDWICAGSDVRPIYDPNASLFLKKSIDYNERYNPDWPKTEPARSQRIAKDRSDALKDPAIVCAHLAVYGVNVTQPVFVFPPFFDNGFRIVKSNKMLIVGKGESNQGYVVERDDDARSILLVHERRHMVDMRDGIRIGGRLISRDEMREWKVNDRDEYIAFWEARGTIAQLEDPRFVINSLYAWATYQGATQYVAGVSARGVSHVPDLAKLVSEYRQEIKGKLARYEPAPILIGIR